MTRQHINAYRAHLARLHAASGSLNEGVVSKAFGDLLVKMVTVSVETVPIVSAMRAAPA